MNKEDKKAKKSAQPKKNQAQPKKDQLKAKKSQIIAKKEETKEKKNEIYQYYKKHLSGLESVTMNPMNPDGDANNWLSCITIEEASSVTPDLLMDAMEAENMEARPIWKPMHLQPVFTGCDFFKHPDCNGNSVSESIFKRGFCLPSDVKNTTEDMDRIIAVIKQAF